MGAKLRQKTFGDFGERDAAGVGGQDRAGFVTRGYLAPQGAFGIQVFDDGFDDPVAIGELVEIVLEISGLDESGLFIDEESSRLLLQRGLEALLRGRGAMGASGDIQEKRRNARIGEMRGDARAHGARAEDGDTTNITHELI